MGLTIGGKPHTHVQSQCPENTSLNSLDLKNVKIIKLRNKTTNHHHYEQQQRHQLGREKIYGSNHHPCWDVCQAKPEHQCPLCNQQGGGINQIFGRPQISITMCCAESKGRKSIRITKWVKSIKIILPKTFDTHHPTYQTNLKD